MLCSVSTLRTLVAVGPGQPSLVSRSRPLDWRAESKAGPGTQKRETGKKKRQGRGKIASKNSLPLHDCPLRLLAPLPPCLLLRLTSEHRAYTTHFSFPLRIFLSLPNSSRSGR